MKSAAEKLYLKAFFQRSRDHLFQESGMKNTLFVDEAFVIGRALPPEKRSPAEAKRPAVLDAPVDPKLTLRSAVGTLLRTSLKCGLVLAAILLLPGALIGAPLLWWLGNRGKKSRQSTWKACS